MFLTYTASRWYRPNKSKWPCYQGSSLTHTTAGRHATEFFGHRRRGLLLDSRRCLYGSQRIRPECRPACRHIKRSSRPIRRSQSGLHSAHTVRPGRTWCASLSSGEKKGLWLSSYGLGALCQDDEMFLPYRTYKGPLGTELRSWFVDVQSSTITLVEDN